MILKYKFESHKLTPINKNQYDECKNSLHRHRLYRQSFLRLKQVIIIETYQLIDFSEMFDQAVHQSPNHCVNSIQNHRYKRAISLY